MAGFWLFEGVSQQFFKATEDGRPVLLLGAGLARLQDEQAVPGHAPAGQAPEASFHLSRKISPIDIEAQLHGRGNFIDVLPARARSARKDEGQCPFIDAQVGRDFDFDGFAPRSGS